VSVKGGLAIGIAVLVGLALPARPAATRAEAPVAQATPATAAEINRRLVGQLTDFLTSEYAKQLRRPGWLNRAAGLIGLSRLPTAEATRLVFEQLHKEKHAVAQLVAWQAVLSRAPLLTEAEFREWEQVTHKMAGAGQFQGDLRIGLLEMLSAVPPAPQSRAYFLHLFETTNSLDSRDIPPLIAMGRCLKAWGDARLVESLIGAMSNPSTAFRAELVLRAAGAGGRWAREIGLPAAQVQYRDWWKQNEAAFTAAAPRPEGWKALQPQYLPAFIPMDQIDRSAGQWRKELELGELGLAQMGLSVNIDCSRSMHTEIERLKRDVCAMMAAQAHVAKEPRIGITLFTTGGVTDTLPLTSNPAALVAHIGKARSAGKGTEEEWAGGLEEALRRSNWGPAEEWNRRVIVIISDEPMLNWQFDKALPFVKQAAAARFRIYSVPIHKGKVVDDPLSVPLDRTGSGGAVGAAGGGKGRRQGRGRRQAER